MNNSMQMTTTTTFPFQKGLKTSRKGLNGSRNGSNMPQLTSARLLASRAAFAAAAASIPAVLLRVRLPFPPLAAPFEAPALRELGATPALRTRTRSVPKLSWPSVAPFSIGPAHVV